jgi:hypothetical protein
MVLGLKGLKSAKNMIFKNVLDLEKFSLPWNFKDNKKIPKMYIKKKHSQ